MFCVSHVCLCAASVKLDVKLKRVARSYTSYMDTRFIRRCAASSFSVSTSPYTHARSHYMRISFLNDARSSLCGSTMQLRTTHSSATVTSWPVMMLLIDHQGQTMSYIRSHTLHSYQQWSRSGSFVHWATSNLSSAASKPFHPGPRYLPREKCYH